MEHPDQTLIRTAIAAALPLAVSILLAFVLGYGLTGALLIAFWAAFPVVAEYHHGHG